MTKITVYKTESGQYLGFRCIGHAEYSKHPGDKDVVCASVSVLVINMINSIDELTDDIIQVETDEESGMIDCKFLNELSEKGILLMNSMILGLTSIEKQYGSKYVQVRNKEV